MQGKVERYAFFWAPPFCLLSTLALDNLAQRIKRLPVSSVLTIALCVFQFLLSYTQKQSYIRGYEDAAKYIMKYSKSNIIFSDVYYDASFIFYIRKYDTERKMVVLRGSKMLYSCIMLPSVNLTEYIQSKQQIYNLLNNCGIRCIVIEDKNVFDVKVPSSNLVRETLNSIKLKTNKNMFKDVSLLIYEYNKDVSLKQDTITLPLPIIRERNNRSYYLVA